MENNKAFVARLGNIKPIEGADKIVVADVILGDIPLTQVVVGVDTKENTPVVYFDANMALEDGFVLAIDQLSPDFGKEDFKGIGTYLAKGNRVRCIKLKGTISNGLAIEASKIGHIFQDVTFPEGFSFTELSGTKVCHKWLPPSNNSFSGNMKREHKNAKKRVSRIIPELFRFYVDTAQLLRNLNMISPEDVGSISRKVHGSSFICSKALVMRKLSFKDKVAKLFGVAVNDKEYDTLYASRSVIKNDAPSTGFYKIDIWTELGKKYFRNNLHEGETVYGEVLGYLPNSSSMIQKGYDYGNKQGDYSIQVYRITQTSTDGHVVSLDWSAMKERCKELMVPMVTEFYYGKLKDKYPEIPIDENWHKNFANALKNEYLEKDVWDNLGKKVPDEGIVLRIEGLDIRVFKLKSEKFFLNENAMKEQEVIDIEEQETIV
jgi:hypothetical protein